MHILKPGITWSPDGNQLAVAVKSGKSDAIIFLISKQIKKKLNDLILREFLDLPGILPKI